MGQEIRRHKNYIDAEVNANADETLENSESELVSDNPADIAGGIAKAE